eukprot:gene8222-10985_t
MLQFSPLRTAIILLVAVLGIVFAIPNFFSKEVTATWPSWLPHQGMTLGLDLQGGSHIMLKLERQDIVKERLETIVGDVRTQLRDANIRYTGLSGVGQQIQ